jgi:predicted acetyltransferase
MHTEVAVVLARPAEEPVLTHLFQLYLYDLSEATGADVDETGQYAAPCLAAYWADSTHLPFLIRVADRLAGFALVHQLSRIHGPYNGHVLQTLFVLRKYRRGGVGKAAAIYLFDSFPGAWEVGSHASNVPGHTFWRSVVSLYTQGRYEETWIHGKEWRGPVQLFTSRAAL